MNILVTGGAGYIGSHIAKEIAKMGHFPIVFDDLRTGNAWAVRWGPLCASSLNDKISIGEVFRAYSIEAVMHVAASAYVGDSIKDPCGYFRNNFVATLNLLDEMVKHRVTKLIFSSTCSSYGNAISRNASEADPPIPLNPYGQSKLMVERVLRWYQQAHGIEWVALRYFNVAGADWDGELGEAHFPEPHLIPRLIYAVKGQLGEVAINGSDYDTPDGTAIRDFVHVSDIARAHIHALRHLQCGRSGGVFNLGSGRGYSVMQVIKSVERVTGSKVPVYHVARRPGDSPSLVADVTLACEILSWNPMCTTLDSLVETAWRWHSQRPM